MSSDTTNSKGSQVGLIALVVGIVGIVIALFGFKQGWDTGEVRPIRSWLIALGFWLSIAIGMLFLVQIWSQRADPGIINSITEWGKAHGAPYRAGYQLHKMYQADSMDNRSRPTVPLGGDEKLGY